MAELLRGLTVAIVGGARPLRVAARLYDDLGARVLASSSAATGDAADQLWLGTFEAVGPSGADVDLLLAEHGEAVPGLRARSIVTLSGSSSHAGHPHARLDERLLAAAGGLAVAVGEPERPPLPMPEGSLDVLVGMHVAAAALSALQSGVERTEVAAADVVAWMVATNLQLYLPYGLPWHRAGRRASGSGSCYPWAIFDAADGAYCLIGRTRRDWDALLAMMCRPSWAQDARFRDPRTVGRSYPDEADAFVRPWMARHTRGQLDEMMMRHEFPGGPVLSPEEVLDVPALADSWQAAVHDGREVRVPGRPFDVTASADGACTPPPSRPFVLDLSWVWSGPAVSVALADLGATVVKVESASRPDNTRLRGAPSVAPSRAGAPELETSPYFHALNRGKLSVSLDLKTVEGRQALRRLAERADVIVENLRPGVMDRWGIAPESVLEANPACVFVSMRGYPDHETTQSLRAYAPVLSSRAGLEALVAYPGEPPVGAMSVAFSDALAASQSLVLVLAGLWSRAHHGRGSAITLSQYDAAVFSNGRNLVAAQLRTSRPLEPLEGAEDYVVTADQLSSSPWISSDLITDVRPRWLSPVAVSRLPWRRVGELPAAGGAGPELGQHTTRVLRGLRYTGRTALRALG